MELGSSTDDSSDGGAIEDGSNDEGTSNEVGRLTGGCIDVGRASEVGSPEIGSDGEIGVAEGTRVSD